MSETISEKKLFEILETNEIELNEDVDEKSSDFQSSSNNDILRVEEDIGASWSGVSNCGNDGRISSACRRRLEEWARDKMFEYRHLKWIRFGHQWPVRARITRRRNRWTNERSCRGSATLNCYMEFEKK